MSRPVNRRTALQHLSLGTAMTAAGVSFWPTRSVFAQDRRITVPGQPIKDRYYIICLFGGGWDTLLTLDPRDPTVFTPQAAQATRITLGYDSLTSGPSGNSVDGQGVYLPNRLAVAGRPGRTGVGAYLGDLTLDRNLADICIVRGVNMNTLAHDVGRVRARTGRPPSGALPRGSSAASWLARHYGGGELAPNLAVGEEVYNVDQPLDFDPVSTASVQDLVDTLTQTSAARELDPSVYDAIDELLDGGFPCAQPAESPVMRTAALGRAASAEMLTQNVAGQFDFLANTPAMEAVRAHYGFGASAAELTRPSARGALAVKAITSGFARVVSVMITGSLDSHTGGNTGQGWNGTQGPNQQLGWNAIARMMDDLRATPIGDGSGDSYWDRTTIVAYSDFGRTPWINASGGRDHWLTSAYFLAGADIRGGQVMGASRDVGYMPAYTDLRTGALDAAGEIIRPAHIWQTLFYAAGFDMATDPADMRVPPLLPVLRNG